MKPFIKNEQIQAFISFHQNICNTEEAKEVIKTLEEFRPDWQNLRNLRFERVFPSVYWTYANACMFLHNYHGAVSILEEGFKELEDKEFKYYFGEKSYMNELLARCFVHLADREKACKAALKKVYNELYAINNQHADNFEFYGFRDISVHSLADLTVMRQRSICVALCFILTFQFCIG